MEENFENIVNYIAIVAWEVFFNSDSEEDSEDESNRSIVEKNKNYYEVIIPRFDDKTFKSHFRFERQTMESLFILLHEEHGVFSEVHSGRPQIDLDKQALITVWFLANTEYFRSVADRFGVCKKTCWLAVRNICQMLLKINTRHRIIDWPTSEEAQRTASYFEDKTRFPGVIGCIDGSHIPITKPKLFPNSYVNRKKFHSILLQVVCDEKLLFTNCYAGEAGSIHDACLFRRSNLSRRIDNGIIHIRQEHHLLGDQAYGLKTYILTPFKRVATLNRTQRKYNKVHSKIRVTVERALGLLKGRFRRLERLNSRKPEFNPLLTMSCCILHNYCLRKSDLIDEDFTDRHNFDNLESENSEYVERIAHQKRNNIAHQL